MGGQPEGWADVFVTYRHSLAHKLSEPNIKGAISAVVMAAQHTKVVHYSAGSRQLTKNPSVVGSPLSALTQISTDVTATACNVVFLAYLSLPPPSSYPAHPRPNRTQTNRNARLFLRLCKGLDKRALCLRLAACVKSDFGRCQARHSLAPHASPSGTHAGRHEEAAAALQRCSRELAGEQPTWTLALPREPPAAAAAAPTADRLINMRAFLGLCARARCRCIVQLRKIYGSKHCTLPGNAVNRTL
ncbi:hypothetical protein EGR_02287 [Echinococcus granulosus]|uniref:Uncharacterized protein n=1 Tax=Echinococcus granulosus TaxID=6210 RepID=W6UPY4_ECHGR|nr:hypothetical protein EGR_02287 [Echinococcus granulosus]EUB62846.1 hypothetical protein EGR_02287 [Echinococcus granulosus]